jgi:hypothetical protein
MMPFNFAFEANNLGQVLDLFLALLTLEDFGLILVVEDKFKSTLFIGGFLHTQHLIEFGLPFDTSKTYLLSQTLLLLFLL